MSYTAPIETLLTTPTYKVEAELDRVICEELIKIGVNIDKEELIRALNYDRDQYKKGYEDGKKDIVEAHWIDTDTQAQWISVDSRLYVCSNCGGYFEIGRKRPSFCPWCGASMSEVEE